MALIGGIRWRCCDGLSVIELGALMSDTDWEQGSARWTETGIARVLSAYAVHGGQLFGARRSAENPLTLTHVRWRALGGNTVEAVRAPSEDELDAAERDAWVQLAIHLSIDLKSEPAGPNAAWVALALPQGQAAMLAEQVERASAQRKTQQRSASAAPPSGMSSSSWHGPRSLFEGHPTVQTPSPYGGASAPAGPRRSAPASTPSWADTTPRSLGQASSPSPSPSPTPAAARYNVPQPPLPPGAQSLPQLNRVTFARPPAESQSPIVNTGPLVDPASAEPRRAESGQEVTVLPCIEVELPPMAAGTPSSDYTRDFARDVALHFARAAQTLPTTREVRGWMRGGRLILAARMGVAAGARPPSRAESEAAAQMLAAALAQRTLPYTRMLLADPSEWAQGVLLPA